jgi:hypothetical protein
MTNETTYEWMMIECTIQNKRSQYTNPCEAIRAGYDIDQNCAITSSSSSSTTTTERGGRQDSGNIRHTLHKLQFFIIVVAERARDD